MAVTSLLASLEFSLVALQRYGRARMIRRINEEFQNGNRFDYWNKNWFGIDDGAVYDYFDQASGEVEQDK